MCKALLLKGQGHDAALGSYLRIIKVLGVDFHIFCRFGHREGKGRVRNCLGTPAGELVVRSDTETLVFVYSLGCY